MAHVATRIGTPLQEVEAVDDANREKLGALSIQTVEELIGLIAADSEAVAEFLGGVDLARLQADIGREANMTVMADVDAFRGNQYSLGAIPPASIVPEEQASQDTFEKYVAHAQPTELEPEGSRYCDMRDCLGPVRHQGRRGTCVSFATCAVLECVERRRTGKEVDLSEQFCYWNCKQNDGAPDRPGTYLEVAMSLARSEGVCLESMWPYDPDLAAGNESQGPPPPTAHEDADSYRATAVESLNARASAEIRRTLDANHLVGISIPVYRNWIANPTANLFGLIPMPLPNSPLEGGHAMCCVGYRFDDEFPGGGYLILRNSWGAEWASQSRIEPGYGILPYLYIDTYGWEAWTAS